MNWPGFTDYMLFLFHLCPDYPIVTLQSSLRVGALIHSPGLTESQYQHCPQGILQHILGLMRSNSQIH